MLINDFLALGVGKDVIDSSEFIDMNDDDKYQEWIKMLSTSLFTDNHHHNYDNNNDQEKN